MGAPGAPTLVQVVALPAGSGVWLRALPDLVGGAALERSAALAAYIIGESVAGGVYTILASPLLGLTFGVFGTAIGRSRR